MDEKTRGKLNEILGSFKDKRVIVIGDSILDENVYGKPIGKVLENNESPKFEYIRSNFSYGGAANVVKNLLELGARVSFITLVGKDSSAGVYNSWNHKNLTKRFVTENRVTTLKTKFWAEGKNIMKINRQSHELVSQESEKRILELAAKEIPLAEAVLLVDYRHGFFSSTLIKNLKSLAKQFSKKTIVSSQVSQKESNHLEYNGASLIVLNLKEAKLVDKSYSDNGKNLVKMLNSNICITLGREGSILHIDNRTYQKPSPEVKEVDPTGAGDSFLAVLSLSDYEKNPEEALTIANTWAGLSVEKEGTQTPEFSELKRHILKDG